ncbi:MAG: polyphosphate kinase 1 [Pseudomonadota bacterium]
MRNSNTDCPSEAPMTEAENFDDIALSSSHEQEEDALESAAEAQVDGSVTAKATDTPSLRHDDMTSHCTPEQIEELSCSSLFFNRDINWIQFNAKVLQEALEPKTPLLEQLKFISIFYNNLDEFFMVRVANILRQYSNGVASTAPDKIPPARQLAEIRRQTLHLVALAQAHWNRKLSRQLNDRGVRIVRYNDLSDKQKRFLDQYFIDEIYPALTPQAIDPSHPLPVISNLSINFIVQLRDKHGITRYARLKCPNRWGRFVFTPRTKDAKTYATLGFSANPRDNDIVLLEDLIQKHLHTFFTGHEIVSTGLFRITRNTDIEIEEDEADDLLEAVRGLVDQRRFGAVVRLEVSQDTPIDLRQFLIELLQLRPFQVYRIKGPMAFSEMMALYGLDRSGLKDEALSPRTHPVFREDSDCQMYDHISEKDVLLFHPYDSFMPVQEFIRRSSKDPGVIAIKQTLYRAGSSSPIVDALIDARRMGKQVTAVVELKARFDEERNITWAEEMEKAGVHVVYGMPGMKIHAKLCLVVRRETQGVRRYVHIGTGNYNGATAKIYTDMGLITAHKEICSDVSELFNTMTGYAEMEKYRQLLVSPHGVRKNLIKHVHAEIASHKKYGNGLIIIKCNQLVDKDCIQALYYASMTGVKVRIQVRGVCCLRPEIPGISENIEVTSLVGRFLEHPRIYYFHKNGNPSIYIGSADLMPRNLDSRIEVLVPILSEKLRDHVTNSILLPHMNDNTKSYFLHEDGSYTRRRPTKGEAAINAQQMMMKRCLKA